MKTLDVDLMTSCTPSRVPISWCLLARKDDLRIRQRRHHPQQPREENRLLPNHARKTVAWATLRPAIPRWAPGPGAVPRWSRRSGRKFLRPSTVFDRKKNSSDTPSSFAAGPAGTTTANHLQHVKPTFGQSHLPWRHHLRSISGRDSS